MGNKDKINKIAGIISLIMIMIILSGIVFENDSLLGFPNAMLLYALMPSALLWFGTRKNGCGSCNQSCEVSRDQQDDNIRNNN